MSEEAYENVMGGKLSLKGIGGIEKKKKKKKRAKEVPDSDQNKDDVVGSPTKKEQKKEGEVAERPLYSSGKTPAERKAEERRRKQEQERLKKAAKLSYRERVRDLNDKLSKLSEHHDIPKVAAAGMG
eukprot:CAMPEP_0113879490 /NCGR_PEP_ID=MMETSP0780_2-20120614/7267_1 /TAXON_ID=652834 /ORGANISM="Palpitomonas bilix" /LENGTH=126 /DNA_ID=CAMNT_0000866077 /DNA_START=114 /DNA_END=494 /DNA_ORIENTATION=- /assembly_acc=CAM_ASM_000599